MIILMVAFPRKPVSTFPAIFLIDFKSFTFPRISVFIFPAGRWLPPASLYSCFVTSSHPLSLKQMSHNLLYVMQ